MSTPTILNDTLSLKIWETLTLDEDKRAALMLSHPLTTVEDAAEWAQLLARLPVDRQELESSARCYLAFERAREVRSAADLLRLTLAYCTCPQWSYAMVAAWALIQGVAELSPTALRARLARTRRWLGYLVGRQVQLARLRATLPRVRVRLADATTLQQPGQHGSDWRVHVSFDLAQARVDGVELTDGHTGESLARQAADAGVWDIEMGDRGYARRREIAQTLAQGAHVLLRWHTTACPLEYADGTRFDFLAWLQAQEAALTATATATPTPAEAPPGCAPLEVMLWLRAPRPTAAGSADAHTPAQAAAAVTAAADADADAPRHRLRLVVQRLPPEAAAAALRRLRRREQKHGCTPSALSLKAAEYLIVLTDLPVEPWSAARVLALYRLRWQIELFFKRVKGLLDWGHVRAHARPNAETAQVEILGKLLAVLTQVHWPQADPFWSYWGQQVQHPLSEWRWMQLGLEMLRHAVLGTLRAARCLAVLPRLVRCLCNTPRARPQQLAYARRWLARLALAMATGADFPELLDGGVDCTA